MKKFIVSLFITVSFSAIYAEDGEKYFRNVYIDGRYQQIRTKNQVPDSIAAFTNCYQISYDEQNRIKRVCFMNRGRIQQMSTGVFITLINYTDSTEIRNYTDVTGSLMKNKLGAHKEILKYGANGVPVERQNYDEQNVLINDSIGVARYVYTVDERGWIINEIYFDKDGCRVAATNNIYEHRMHWGTYKFGYQPESSFFDINGNPVEHKENKWAKSVARYDFQGNPVEFRYYGTDGKLTKRDRGYAVLRIKQNKYGLPDEISYYDENDQLSERKDNVAMLRYKYDNRGNAIEIKAFGKNKKLKNGIAIQRYEYDKNGFVVKRTALDKKEKIIKSEQAATKDDD